MHIEHDDTVVAGATRPHHRTTDDGPWSAESSWARLAANATPDRLRLSHAWVDDDADPVNGNAYAVLHHFIGDDGDVGAASTRACLRGIETLNGRHGGTARVSDAERDGVYRHLRNHLVDSGMAEDTIPALVVPELAANMAAAHGKVKGSHTHAHPTYGGQGADKSHDHMHRHDDDSHHGHDHASKVPSRTAAAWPAGQNVMISAGTVTDDPTTAGLAASAVAAWDDFGAPVLSAMLAAAYAAVPEGGSLVAAAMTALGAPWGVEQRGDGWTVIGRDGDAATRDTYAEALADIAGRAFVDSNRPVLGQTWRSEMAYEDVDTGDGRYIAPGALQYRDCPLPLMLQTTTDMGHFGAVLSGIINTAKTTDGTAMGSGEFDDNEAGNQFVQVIEARGKYGVSIDGMSPAEAEFECTERDEDGYCLNGRMRFNLLTIGGLTGTPFPAFKDAFISFENRAATASGEPEAEPEAPCVDCEEKARAAAAMGRPFDGKQDPAAVGKEDPQAFTAAADPAALPAPAEWFANPGFAVGDGRVVLQPDDEHYACPLTITADGRVFGHMAGWFTCHTGYAAECVLAPRSRSGYAAFLLRPMMTADGNVVRVGHLTMGCGHAETDRPVPVGDVRAHYDGGPGAVRMAFVACGEDEFGIWFAGCLNPAATPEQVREFAACSVSGDWREVWRGKGLDLVACLAGVTVPGFPVSSALAAAGLRVEVPELALPRDPIARFVDGRPVTLVAAGVVRRQLPWEAALAAQARRIESLESTVRDLAMVATALRPLAVDRIVADALPALVD